jgi:hypothetical protein
MQYSEIELKAQDYADEAFREVVKVAEEFARQTGRKYHRSSNCWFSTSSFPANYEDKDCWKKQWNTVSTLYNGDNNEAYECAWEIERRWNELVPALNDKYDSDVWDKILTDDDQLSDYYDRQADLDLDALDHIRDEIGKCVENWLDAATEAAYDEFIEDAISMTQLDR